MDAMLELQTQLQTRFAPVLAFLGETSWAHLFVELVFVTVIIILLLQKSYKPSKQGADLTDAEVDQLVAEWNPEPLHPTVSRELREYTPPVVTGIPGAHTTVDGKNVTNLAALNFLGIAGDETVKRACAETIQKYGVGSCGPRGFYGTIDVHLEFEERVAKFLGTESAILYSYDLATVSSAIPAFAKRGDVIMCDDGVSWGIQSGIQLSRSDVVYFKHNDMNDLEAKMIETEKKLKKKSSPTRRFIVVEGIYQNHGDICPLPKIMELRTKYKYYLVVDESISFGVLGSTGRGVTEHFGVATRDVDMLCASMGNALGSVGGFCAGNTTVVEHQRLSGLGYCFSASLPPFLATAAIEAINTLECNAAVARRLQKNATILYRHLSRLDNVDVEGDSASPLLHIRIRGRSGNADEDRKALQQVADKALAHNVLVTCSFYSKLDRWKPAPSIRVCVQATHTEKDIAEAVQGLSRAVDAVLRR